MASKDGISFFRAILEKNKKLSYRRETARQLAAHIDGGC